MPLEIDGCRVEYEDIPGRPDRTTLVLLHEGLGSIGLWRGLPRTLAELTRCRTIAFSRLGHGASEPPPKPRDNDFMEAEAVSVLPALLDRWQVGDPLLIGHSDGASIALLHAAAHPVAGLVLIAPHVFVEEMTLAAIREADEDFENGDLRQRLARHHRQPEAAFHNWRDVWLDPEFTQWNIVDRVPRIGCPMLLVQGKSDPYGSLAQLDAIETAARAPTTRLLVPGGHAPHLEHQQVVVPAITRFIAERNGLAAETGSLT